MLYIDMQKMQLFEAYKSVCLFLNFYIPIFILLFYLDYYNMVFLIFSMFLYILVFQS